MVMASTRPCARSKKSRASSAMSPRPCVIAATITLTAVTTIAIIIATTTARINIIVVSSITLCSRSITHKRALGNISYRVQITAPTIGRARSLHCPVFRLKAVCRFASLLQAAAQFADNTPPLSFASGVFFCLLYYIYESPTHYY